MDVEITRDGFQSRKINFNCEFIYKMVCDILGI